MDTRNADDGAPKADLIDRAIDRSVREMLDVEPRGDLRARVIERIEHPRRAFKWTWLMAPLAAAAVLVLAVLFWKPEKGLVTRPLTNIALRAPAARQRIEITRNQASRNVSSTHAARPDERVVRAALATADEANVSAERPAGFAVVDALAPPQPIAIEQIAPADPPAIGRLDVAPLQLPALEVDALPDLPRERHD